MPIYVDPKTGKASSTQLAGTVSGEEYAKDLAARTPADSGAAPVFNPRGYVLGESEADKLAKQSYTDSLSFNADTAREEKRKAAQSMVDDINSNFYKNILPQAQETNTDRLGQARSMAARSGLLGGNDFGTAQLDKTGKYNESVIAGLEAQRQAQANAIFADFDKRADELVQAEKTRAVTARDTYINFLRGKKEEAITGFANLAKSGAIKSLEQLSEDDYKDWLKQTGYSESDAFLAFNANKRQAERVELKALQLKDGSYMFYGQDPITGQMIEQKGKYSIPEDSELKLVDGVPYYEMKDASGEKVLKKASGYQPKGWQYVSTPAERDAFKSSGRTVQEVNGKIYVAPTKTIKTAKGGYDIVDSVSNQKIGGQAPAPSPAPSTATEKKAIADMLAQLSSITGSDGYISPDNYTLARDAWVKLKLNPTTFDTKFKGFKNPNNKNYVTDKVSSNNNSQNP